ncbi:putative ABC transport system permease protein [Limimaricola soesokkakensis]|uniref:FtsX-like permease family protein n=1 Tax=Limimaricola soesokkakensis TaxID=1343159 RepID=A0A1X6YWI5_9RHOB|nr:FtsX-like permease family protein [Limimaricola soesokkakensis]PSK87576.1 putative ABC transport system permease protein [Limimaricola soesokkakensis]SLN31425.1 FtsX-like permease family protein [Limimaricola soesokkakensis]
MSAGLAARLARRELRGGLRGFRIFLACLALGVAAIAAVGMVRSAIQAGLERESAAILGGDAEIELTYRYADPTELEWMQGVATTVSETVDFRSMAVVERDGDTERALTQIRAVDGAYPLVGEVRLEPEMPIEAAFAGTDGLPGIVVERALADRLALSPGDRLRLGTQDFVLMAVLTRYPDSAAGGFGLGPRSLVLAEDLSGSGLLAEGTLFSTAYRLDLPPEADLQALEDEAESRFEGSGLRWRDVRRGAGGTERFIDRLGSFLVLIGLSGLAVGGVGISAAVRAYLAGKTATIATLRTLGATRATIFLTYFLQIGALTLLGLAIGLALGIAVPLVLAPLITARLPIPAEFAIYPRPLIEAALYGALVAMIFTLWPLARTENVRAATLFRDAMGAGRALPRRRYMGAILALLAVLLGAAVLFSGTWRLTLSTAGGIGGALLLLTLAALGVQALARRFGRGLRGRPGLRLALGAIGKRGGETGSVVLSLGLGLSVLAAVGQIDGNLRRAIQNDLPEVAPAYFFVDIQPDQIEGFRARLDDDPQVSRVDSAPMLRGIVSEINGRAAREVADHWVLHGDRGLTYSATPPDGEEIVAGEWWAEDYAGPPLVSFAEEEALEIGLGIGDEITVNVLGRDVTATIANLRRVDFGSAAIAFVMSMNPGALAGAPHSWISTVYAEEEAEAAILRDLADAYPNITAIRVRDAIDQVTRVVDGIAAATRYGAAATLLTGFLVLIGAAAAGERSRTYEAAILKTLGASRRRILSSFALRAALLGAAAGLVALGAGVLGGWAAARFVMETDFSVIWSSAVGIVLGGALASLLAGLGFAWRPLKVRPAQVLRAQD